MGVAINYCIIIRAVGVKVWLHEQQAVRDYVESVSSWV